MIDKEKIIILKKRAQFFKAIRDYFYKESVWEVDTPIMSQYGNPDPALLNFKSCFHGPGKLYQQETYLITSPEYHMKRLLSMNSGSIYYLGKVFRDGELSARHNPEFTILEWYRIGYSLEQLIDEVIAIINHLSCTNLVVEKRSYRSLFIDYLSIDPFVAGQETLRLLLHKENINLTFTPQTIDEYLDILMTHVIEPALPKTVITVIYDYPAAQASLAKIKTMGDISVGKRFEVYWQGLELANGYEELTDDCEQRARFTHENRLRAQYELAPIVFDELLLESLEQLPECSGVALGVDRLFMAINNITNINEALSFGFEVS